MTQQTFAQGGTVSGTGQVIRKDGTRVDFTMTSDPLTKDQAEKLNAAKEGKTDGGDASHNR